MASLSLSRPHWSLQLTRSSRAFTISFTSFASPQRHEIRRLHSRASGRTGSSRSGVTGSQTANGASIRSMFTSTRSTRAYQAANTAGAKSTASQPSPPASTPPTEANKSTSALPDLTSGLSDQPVVLDEGERQVDWANSFHGLSTTPFSKEAAEILMQPVEPKDVEIKPDGIVYLPEIKYRRILNKAFGPGGWGLAPRGETIVTAKSVTREYALVAHGRLVSVARGEQDYFSPEGIPTATEGCKSNAMMRCCKDLGVVSELWDPRWIREFLGTHAKEVFVEHMVTKKVKKVYMRKDDEPRYPFKKSGNTFVKTVSQAT